MEVLKFEIFGQIAHFKNPENNYNIEVTYDHITKTHILGLLGAIIGLRGRQQEREIGYIEWYEELKGTMVSIVPSKPKFNKFIDEAINCTGYANDKGSSQIINRQYLKDVNWIIYVNIGNIKEDIRNKLISNITGGKSVYPLYLGQTGCFANIKNVDIITLEEINIEDVEYCSSMFRFKDVEIEKETYSGGVGYLSKLMLPIGLNDRGLYVKEWIGFTNYYTFFTEGEFYKHDNLILSFI